MPPAEEPSAELMTSIARRGIPGRRPSLASAIPAAPVMSSLESIDISEHNLGSSSNLAAEESRYEIKSDDSKSDDGSKFSFRSSNSIWNNGGLIPNRSQHHHKHRRSSSRHSGLRSIQQRFRHLDVWVELLQAVCYVYHIFAIPYQIAMIHSARGKLLCTIALLVPTSTCLLPHLCSRARALHTSCVRTKPTSSHVSSSSSSSSSSSRLCSQ